MAYLTSSLDIMYTMVCTHPLWPQGACSMLCTTLSGLRELLRCFVQPSLASGSLFDVIYNPLWPQGFSSILCTLSPRWPSWPDCEPSCFHRYFHHHLMRTVSHAATTSPPNLLPLLGTSNATCCHQLLVTQIQLP